jgi:hypothetical protein
LKLCDFGEAKQINVDRDALKADYDFNKNPDDGDTDSFGDDSDFFGDLSVAGEEEKIEKAVPIK